MNRTFWKKSQSTGCLGAMLGRRGSSDAMQSPSVCIPFSWHLLISQLLPPWSLEFLKTSEHTSKMRVFLTPLPCFRHTAARPQTAFCSLLHHLRAGVPSHWWLRWPQHLGQACHMVCTQQVCQWESKWLSGKVCGWGSRELSCLLFSVPLAISVRQMNLARKGSYLLLIM